MSPAHLSLATSSEAAASGTDFAALVDRLRAVGRAVIAPASIAVDRDARFPGEAMAALCELRLLGAYVPTQYGGLGLDIGKARAASPMIFTILCRPSPP